MVWAAPLGLELMARLRKLHYLADPKIDDNKAGLPVSLYHYGLASVQIFNGNALKWKGLCGASGGACEAASILGKTGFLSPAIS